MGTLQDGMGTLLKNRMFINLNSKVKQSLCEHTVYLYSLFLRSVPIDTEKRPRRPIEKKARQCLALLELNGLFCRFFYYCFFCYSLF